MRPAAGSVAEGAHDGRGANSWGGMGAGAGIALGAVVRVCLLLLLRGTSWLDLLAQRPELVTPSTSFARAEEGNHLGAQGLWGRGDVHHPPLLLFALKWAGWAWGEAGGWCLLVCADLLLALLLADIAACAKRMRGSGMGPTQLLWLYLFNPWTIASLLSKSTIVLSNVALVAALVAALRGRAGFAGFALALGTYLSLYPAVLLLPLCYLVKQRHKAIIVLVSSWVSWLGSLMIISTVQVGNWDWTWRCYGFIVLAPELTPNIGLYWYYFTEAFAHFRPFFTFVFQFHPIFYLLPLCIRLSDGIVMFWLMGSLLAVMRSYPSLGDFLPFILLLPVLHSSFLSCSKRAIFFCVGLVFLNVVGPITWYLWMEHGAGNANFYYAATLFFFIFQAWLLRDVLQHVLAHPTKKP